MNKGIILFLILLPIQLMAMIPLESLLLGDFSQQYTQEENDPINYVFQQSQSLLGKRDHLRALGIFRGYYEEGDNYNRACKETTAIRYPSYYDKETAKRVVMTSLQYVGLDLAMRSMGTLARQLNWEKKEFQNLADSLVGGYCSQNITLMSVRQIKKYLVAQYDSKNIFRLPQIKENPLFPAQLPLRLEEDEVYSRQFNYSIELFKSFCSWGNQVDNPRMLTPFLRNPIIMSFLSRVVFGHQMAYDLNTKRPYRVDAKKGLYFDCNGLICRQTKKVVFINKFPRSFGSRSIEDDFNRLYCHEFRNIWFNLKDPSNKIKKWVDNLSLDHQNFLVSHMLSLATGVPDFFSWGETFEDGKETFMMAIKEHWNNWSLAEMARTNENFFYEESLTLKLLSLDYFPKRDKSQMSLHFDVNLGEFDQMVDLRGKITLNWNLTLKKRLLAWTFSQFKNMSQMEEAERTSLRRRIKQRWLAVVDPKVEQAQKVFEIPPWKLGMSSFLVKELLLQVESFGQSFDLAGAGDYQVPIYFHYAPFALKYLNYIHKVQNGNKERSQKIGKLRNFQL